MPRHCPYRRMAFELTLEVFDIDDRIRQNVDTRYTAHLYCYLAYIKGGLEARIKLLQPHYTKQW